MNILGLLFSFGLLMIAVTAHEYAHGWVAYKLGDSTAKYSGRLTLNPLAHIDLFGTIILPLIIFISTRGAFVFAAAKPVPINYWALRNPRRDMMLVGISGPLVNFIFAVVLSLILKFLPDYGIFSILLQRLAIINIVLGVFNLIPIPPLDGSRILAGLLPADLASRYNQLEPFGFFIIALLLVSGVLNRLVLPWIVQITTLLGIPLL